MKLNYFLVSIFLLTHLSSSAATVNSQSENGSDRVIEWQTLTKQNFSSQIQLCPSFLLIVTVPWCGESMALMKELSHVVSQMQPGLSDLKLMRLFRNKEKMLAESIGAREGITVIYYHNFVAYKYQGRLRVLNIVRSVISMNLVDAADLPLKALDTHDELMEFIESTDKAVILYEFCGWTKKLLNKGNTSIASDNLGMQDILTRNPVEPPKASYSSTVREEEAKKVAGYNEELMCKIPKSFSCFPWVGEFSAWNGNFSSIKSEDVLSDSGLPCNSKEFKRFDSFLTKFIDSARKMFLPLEKQKFGLVTESSLLTSLGNKHTGSWLVMHHFAGYPGYSETLEEGDDLDKFLLMNSPLVKELEDEGHHSEVLLGNSPSLVLFVDRSSDLSSVREASKAALNALRQTALNYQASFWSSHNSNSVTKVASSVEAPKRTYQHPELELSPTSLKIKATQKMSVMIVDGDKRFSIDKLPSDLHGSSLQKILDQIVNPSKGSKLSLVAREAGFQLLSHDFDVKLGETSQEVSSEKPFQESASENSEVSTNKDNDELISDTSSPTAQDTASKSASSQSFCSDGEKRVDLFTDLEHKTVESDTLSTKFCSAIVGDSIGENNNCPPMKNSGKTPVQSQSFNGNFYFSDGGHRLLRSLTGGSKTPSLVILDPDLRLHYVMEEDSSFGYFALVDFVNGFINRSLTPYHSSESSIPSQIETSVPSRVNSGFHEKGPIPKVSAKMLSRILMNAIEGPSPGSGVGRNEDVLVLFGNNWCAFCQRIELVVREVYHALRGYKRVLNVERRNIEVAADDDLKDVGTLKIPQVYTIDCSLNECRSVLGSGGQIQAFPALILFPGGRKTFMSYDGDMEVSEIIRFLADHGSYSGHLVDDTGILSSKVNSSDRNQELSNSASVGPDTESFDKPTRPFEVQLKSSPPKTAINAIWIKPESSKILPVTSLQVDVGSILVATEKLQEAYPFDQSKILIVKADDGVGYQGLILNKHISWDSFQELTEDSETFKRTPLSLGGPVITRDSPLVALTRKHSKGDHVEVLPGIYFLDQSATALEISEIKAGDSSGITDYWFFLGFSSWGWEQLIDEIADGSWNVQDGRSGQVIWP